MSRALQDDGRQQPHERAVGAKLRVACLNERLRGRGAATLDLADVLARVDDSHRERFERQVVGGAQRAKLGAQPGGMRGVGIERLRGPAATRLRAWLLGVPVRAVHEPASPGPSAGFGAEHRAMCAWLMRLAAGAAVRSRSA